MNMDTDASQVKKISFWKKTIRFLFKAILFFFIFTIGWVIVLKWMPVWFTSTMIARSMEAYWQGKDAKIYYEWVGYDNISEHAKVAVVASEDQRFPTHFAVDYAAIEVAVKENKTRKRVRGASTITQQTAKNVFLWQKGGKILLYVRKGLEFYFAYLIEIFWGKQRILEVYLNVAEMGPQTFGVQAASKRYFRKSASQLLPIEAARLAAVLPNPRIYLAQLPNQYVLIRSNQILYQMQLLGGYQYLKDLRRF